MSDTLEQLRAAAREWYWFHGSLDSEELRKAEADLVEAIEADLRADGVEVP